MLDLILVVVSLFWFCNTDFFRAWKGVIIGGSQFSVSVTTVIVLFYIIIAVFSFMRLYYMRRRE